MDPFTAAIIGSTVLKVGGDLSAADAEYQQGYYESGIAEENARRATQSAEQIRQAGNQAEQAKRREIRRSLGRTAAAMAQSGTGSGGSNALLLKQASTEGEMDALNLRYGYQSDAYSQDLEALNQKAAAQAARRRARGAKRAGIMNAASSALGGFSNYSGMRAQSGGMTPRTPTKPAPTRGPNKYGF
jgi:hypothetical protein